MMASNALLIYLALIAHFYECTNGFNREPVLRYCTLKSLPIFALAALVYTGHGEFKGRTRVLHSLGLFFGGCGDFLITFHEYGLITAAIAFGVGHILYIATYAPKLKCLTKELSLLVTSYALFVVHFFLAPHFILAPLSTLVLVMYSVLLGLTVVISGSLYYNGGILQEARQRNNFLRFVGHCLFLFSDSILLLEHGGHLAQLVIVDPFIPSAVVLGTYYAAQYLILEGALETEKLMA